MNIVNHSFELGETVLKHKSLSYRKKMGQFMTPPKIARFMAKKLASIQDGDHILEPALGSGILACAVIERLINEGRPVEIWLDGYEVDSDFANASRKALQYAVSEAGQHDIIVHASLIEEDFILKASTVLLPFYKEKFQSYDHIIANPPYFKLNSNDKRAKVVSQYLKGTSNIYTVFLGLSAHILSEEMKNACFIIPRSFCSGAYFSKFRQQFLQIAEPFSFHIFNDREGLFETDSVLQENIIITFRKRIPERVTDFVEISSSKNTVDLDKLNAIVVDRSIIFDKRKESFYRIPTLPVDVEVIRELNTWPSKLTDFGATVSTGPVVPFRSRDLLLPAGQADCSNAVPLLWIHNISAQNITWPVQNGKDKPQGIDKKLGLQSRLLIPTNANYVLIRRFSAKEDDRRLISAPLLAGMFSCEYIGVENHLNFVHRPKGSLEVEEAIGLSMLLNSSLLDRYYRTISGSTQVNAQELRMIPLPPIEVIKNIGIMISKCDTNWYADFEKIVFTILYEHNFLTRQLYDFYMGGQNGKNSGSTRYPEKFRVTAQATK